MVSQVKDSSALAQPFLDGLSRRRLMFQRCTVCLKTQTLARYACQFCQAEALDWRESEGLATIQSVTEVGRAPTDSFKALIPYVVVIALLEEGFKVMGHGQSGLQIDDPVRADYIEHEGQVLLKFVRIEQG